MCYFQKFVYPLIFFCRVNSLINLIYEIISCQPGICALSLFIARVNNFYDAYCDYIDYSGSNAKASTLISCARIAEMILIYDDMSTGTRSHDEVITNKIFLEFLEF